jgi:hypothetical protein
MTLQCYHFASHPTAGGNTCCFANYYGDGKDCQPCIDGADCRTIGSTLAFLQLAPGYWRASSNTTDVRKCWLAEACVNNNTLSRTAATRRTTDTAAIDQVKSNDVGDIYCADGYKGPCKYIQIAIFVKCVSAPT